MRHVQSESIYLYGLYQEIKPMQLKFAIERIKPPPKLFSKNKCMTRRRPISKPTQAYLHNYEVVSHSVTYFTLIYCTMNWWRYRQIRKGVEKQQKEDKKEIKNEKIDRLK
jgi:hypothetical protein